jgi:hypothetical protein
MADKDIFKERERSLEEEYFRKQDAKLLEKLRERDRLEAIAKALAEKLRTDDPALLRRVLDLGATADTGPAFLLAPLVQVAWAEGKVTDAEREEVLRIAEERGIEAGSAAHAQIDAWLRARPPDALFDVALATLRVGLSVLPPDERAERVKGIVDACREVAQASGGLARLLGLGSGVSMEEESVLEAITATLRTPG